MASSDEEGLNQPSKSDNNRYTPLPITSTYFQISTGNDLEITTTLKVESFAGRNFRDFANFSFVRESLYPRNFLKFGKIKTKAFFKNGVS